MSRRPPTPVGRRSLLAGALGLAVSGCTLNNPFSSPRTATATARPSADLSAALATVTAIHAARARIEATTLAYPALSGPLTGLDALHGAHLAALARLAPVLARAVRPGAAPVPAQVPAQIPATAAAALRAALTQEAALHAALTRSAGSAQDGRFARLLGSMAAAISQQTAVLSR